MIKSYGYFERTYSSGEALDIALKFLEKNNFEIEISQVGNNIITTHCVISNNNIKSNGTGKGLGDQSKISAIFEAIEHFYTISPVIPSNMAVMKLDLDNNDKELAEGSPEFKTISNSQTLFFSRVPFKNFSEKSTDLWFPYFLTDPYFEPHDEREKFSINSFSLLRYGTNSGTASGLSPSDAILHGLLEIIERDAIGIELLRTVFKRPPFPVRRIVLKRLAERLIDIITQVEFETNGTVEIWDITTDIGIPVALVAIGTNENSEVRYFGSGSSLNMEYAIERAMLEALQYFHAVKIGVQKEPLSKTQNLAGLANFQKCYLQNGLFDYQGGYVDIKDISNYNIINLEGLSTKSQVGLILKRLQIQGITAYFRPILENGIYIYQVVAPYLERFHLVSYGVPVTPGTRGKKVLKLD